MTLTKHDSRCKAKNKRGEPCGAAATAGGLCFFHANPNKASELGRIGGRRNRAAAPAESVDPLPKLDKVGDLRDLVERLIRETYTGQLHPRVAAGLAPLLHLRLRAIEPMEMERRVAKLEKQTARDEVERATGEGNCDVEDRDLIGSPLYQNQREAKP